MPESLRRAITTVVALGLAIVVVFGLIQGDRTAEDRAQSIGSKVKCPSAKASPSPIHLPRLPGP